MSNPLLEVKNLSQIFKVGRKKYVSAVNDISFSVNRGETIGVVGESGCGKTTLGRSVMGIYTPSEGEVIYEGTPIDFKDKDHKKKFASKVQMIFQDPFASLNPRMTVGEIICEGWNYHRMFTPEERQKKMVELLEIVGLNQEHSTRFPHEFSGGQRQRIGIARALSMNPEVIICDEPISALDVSIQAQVMNLLMELQRKQQLTYIFIAHDLLMVRYISTNILVMYLGTKVEFGASNDVFYRPVHPYTEALFSAIPVPDPEKDKSRERIMLTGDLPSPINAPKGCAFSTRCKYVQDICRETRPESKEVAKGHFCACHFPLLHNLDNPLPEHGKA